MLTLFKQWFNIGSTKVNVTYKFRVEKYPHHYFLGPGKANFTNVKGTPLFHKLICDHLVINYSQLDRQLENLEDNEKINFWLSYYTICEFEVTLTGKLNNHILNEKFTKVSDYIHFARNLGWTVNNDLLNILKDATETENSLTFHPKQAQSLKAQIDELQAMTNDPDFQKAMANFDEEVKNGTSRFDLL